MGDERRPERARSVRDARPEDDGETIAAVTLPVDPTGVPGLDPVLGGGLARGTLLLVVGPPGSGKTTLATQLAFAAATAGRRTLILTALAEPVSKLLAHLHTFHFYDEALVGDRVQVLSIQPFLDRGLAGVADELVALARQARASLVVLDGFQGVQGADGDLQASREFLFAAGGKLNVLGATVVITTAVEAHDPAFYGEATVADAVVGLEAVLQDVRQRRWLTVLKVRGAAPLTGRHGLTLSAAGATVYPRLEARVVAGVDGPPVADTVAERVVFDLPELDALLGDGLTRGTITLALGDTGTGKTLLGLHFALAGVRIGEPALFLGFRETPGQLGWKADAFTLGTRWRAALASNGGLTLLRRAPVELNIDVLADELLAALDRTGARRLVVDSMIELERAMRECSDPRRVPNYLAALAEALHVRGVTTLFIKEHDALDTARLALAADWSAAVSDNVLLLQQVTDRERLRRVLSVHKLRHSAHDVMLREFVIVSPAGIRVLGPFESDHGVLAELARRGDTAVLLNRTRSGEADEPSREPS